MKYIVCADKIKTEFPLDFYAILNCGQTFRFKESSGGYEVFSGAFRCFCRGNVIISDNPTYFVKYFDLDTDYDALINRLSCFGELKRGIEVGKGIRILKQDPFEVIISFIISANNNIPRIKGIIEKLCFKFGSDMGGYHAFPTPQSLAKVSSDEFRAAGAGFRDKYLASSAKTLYETDFMQKLISADTEHAEKMLMTLKGVGPKVADCILLFGLSKWDCFPVDTWIYKQCATKELDTPLKVRSHYLKRYGELAGLAQQYIFYGAREK